MMMALQLNPRHNKLLPVYNKNEEQSPGGRGRRTRTGGSQDKPLTAVVLATNTNWAGPSTNSSASLPSGAACAAPRELLKREPGKWSAAHMA